MGANSHQEDVMEQLETLKELILKMDEKPSFIEIAEATIAAECVLERIREFCDFRFRRGCLDGMESFVA